MRRRIQLVATTIAVAACSSNSPKTTATPVTQAPAPATQTQPAPTTTPVGRGGDPTDSTAAPGGGRAGGGGRGNAGGGAAAPQAYNRVVTREAKTRRGLFAVHQIGDRLLFEIPRNEWGKDMLVVGRFARAAAPAPAGRGGGGGGGGFGNYAGDEFTNVTLRWERNANRVILRSPSYTISADTSNSVYRSVQNSNYGPIIATFNVEAYGADSAAVIDGTRLFTTNTPEFAAIEGPGPNPIDASRSYI